jgi:hypothetical protein
MCSTISQGINADKHWVTFEWTDAPSSVSWNPEKKTIIDHRLIVKFHSQTQEILKQWKNVTRVKFVEDSSKYYKMELYDSQNRQLQHIYLHCETLINNHKLIFLKKQLTQDDWE